MVKSAPATLIHAVRSLALLPVLCALHLPAQTQPTTPLRFEVVTVRPHPFAGDEPSDRHMLPGGRFVATATTVRTLLRIAFGANAPSIAGAPGWVDKELFDINGTTVDHTDTTKPEQFQALILALLVDRFQLKFHVEDKPSAVYWLELQKPGKPGPALHPSAPGSQPNMSNNSNSTHAAMNVTMESMTDIAAALSRQVGRPVEDHTGLAGNFDFQIEWTPEGATDATGPSLFTVLNEQLGLKLQPAKGTTKAVIVDQIARPSVN